MCVIHNELSRTNVFVQAVVVRQRTAFGTFARVRRIFFNYTFCMLKSNELPWCQLEILLDSFSSSNTMSDAKLESGKQRFQLVKNGIYRRVLPLIRSIRASEPPRVPSPRWGALFLFTLCIETASSTHLGKIENWRKVWSMFGNRLLNKFGRPIER